jgi:DNA invertase Pin-like site-specific DNA recombinase
MMTSAHDDEYRQALFHARRGKATLVVAKLDRLARYVAFLSALMDSTVPFVACDNSHANRLTKHILAAVAEAKAKAISDRTKVALAAAKARGTFLRLARPGHWEGREGARLAGARMGAKIAGKVVSARAREAYSDLMPEVSRLHAERLSLRGIAGRLNAEGHTTRRGRPWNPVQVARVLERTAVND